jgi:hypothetical protein
LRNKLDAARQALDAVRVPLGNVPPVENEEDVRALLDFRETRGGFLADYGRDYGNDHNAAMQAGARQACLPLRTAADALESTLVHFFAQAEQRLTVLGQEERAGVTSCSATGNVRVTAVKDQAGTTSGYAWVDIQNIPHHSPLRDLLERGDVSVYMGECRRGAKTVWGHDWFWPKWTTLGSIRQSLEQHRKERREREQQQALERERQLVEQQQERERLANMTPEQKKIESLEKQLVELRARSDTMYSIWR